MRSDANIRLSYGWLAAATGGYGPYAMDPEIDPEHAPYADVFAGVRWWDLAGGVGTSGPLDRGVRAAATAGLGVTWRGLYFGERANEAGAELHVPVTLSAIASFGALRLDARAGTGWALLRSANLRDVADPSIPTTSGWLGGLGVTWALPDARYGRLTGPSVQVAAFEELGATGWRVLVGIGQ